ncbi:hypothetical protein JCM12298_07980 [Desulfothermus naphthae]
MVKDNFFAWDKELNEELLIFRQMKWDDPKKLLKIYSKSKLKETFLKYYFKFDKKNRAFWELILEINNEEIDQRTDDGVKRNL